MIQDAAESDEMVLRHFLLYGIMEEKGAIFMTAQELERNNIVKAPGHPWRRFFAYTFDHAIYAVLGTWILYRLMNLYPLDNNIIVSIIGSIIWGVWMIPLDSFLIAKYGTTLGKCLLGIRLTHDSGRKLTFAEALNRNIGRFKSGEGYGIIGYSVYRNWQCYLACADRQSMEWDKDVAYEIKEIKIYRNVIFAAVYAVVMLLTFTVQISASFPKYKDDGTVETFVKNYNAVLEHIYGVEEVYLDADGYLNQREQLAGNYSVNLSFSEEEEKAGKMKLMKFEKQDGKISRITFERYCDNIGYVLSNDVYSQAALYTVIASQEEFRIRDFLKLESMLRRYGENVLTKEYTDSLNNVEFQKKVQEKHNESYQMNLWIQIK